MSTFYFENVNILMSLKNYSLCSQKCFKQSLSFTEMSESNKLFNPFGNHETHLKELKLQLEQTVLKSVQYIEDVNDLTESFEQLTEIAKSIPETSVLDYIPPVNFYIN